MTTTMSEPDETAASTSNSLDHWLDALARPVGAPGGGAAAGVMLGISAALLRMVAEYTSDDERAVACGRRLADRRREALAAAEADSAVSAALGSALALSTDDPQRDGRVASAAVAGARSSAELGAVGVTQLEELRLLVDIGNRTLGADLVVAAEALAAGLAGASVNLRANLELARKHGAGDAEDLSGLDTAVRAIVAARAAASTIAGEQSARFDAS